jgi:hypothetical protein
MVLRCHSSAHRPFQGPYCRLMPVHDYILTTHPSERPVREAKVEARAARRDDKRAREDSPEMVKLIGGGDVMGGDDSFAAAKARRVNPGPGHAVKAGVRVRGLPFARVASYLFPALPPSRWTSRSLPSRR